MKRYVLVGASYRSENMFATPIVRDLSSYARVVAIYDPNHSRCEVVKKWSGIDCPSYDNFDKMIAECEPDCGIVTTIDRYHHEYIIRLLEAGVDAITEKPMTIDAEKCDAILDAEKRTGKHVTVTFNYRFAPFATAIKQAIRDGMVGDVLNVSFEYMLDTSHGADYFRRWHRRKENSGGLLVHKATHHFDLVNWWIDDEPVEVTAFGTRGFYGPTRAERGERCLTCGHKGICEFYFDLTADPIIKELYLDCESVDGYFRDRCVFADEIDIEDSMSVNVKYAKGAVMSYSLIAHSPYEGWKIAISGTDGRLEAAEYHSGLRESEPAYYFTVFNRTGQQVDYTIPKSGGWHGGGDTKLQRMVFAGDVPDPLGHQAGSYAGAISILVGVAANRSIKESRSIRIDDLVRLSDYRPQVACE